MICLKLKENCPKCGASLEAGEDIFGPFLRCFMCGLYIDLLQPPPETLAMLKKAASYSGNTGNSDHKRLSGPYKQSDGRTGPWSTTRGLHDRLDGRHHRERHIGPHQEKESQCQ